MISIEHLALRILKTQLRCIKTVLYQKGFEENTFLSTENTAPPKPMREQVRIEVQALISWATLFLP